MANSKFKTDLQTLESKHKSEASELAKAQALLAERGNELKVGILFNYSLEMV